MALREAPSDFDVLYLGWAGWRGGNFYELEKVDSGKAIRQAQYVYTTVAYVISPKAARRLLSIATPIDQPVDNFMAWEASQGNLKSFVILDEGDSDDLWAGGIVDQFDFVGDSDVKKSDGARAVVFTPEKPGELAVTPEKLAADPKMSPPKVNVPAKGGAPAGTSAEGSGPASLLGKLSETGSFLRKIFQAHVG
ncbi:unnamed protein product [Prorocentrum cordatum]|uniref:Uncharacterized protein n=1 Tax=Prorocentrum cordatum TaxID=2364126 RepID=A0ABN9SL06_9DINO|nr:unnamed protein product [Polarella glacialis]